MTAAPDRRSKRRRYILLSAVAGLTLATCAPAIDDLRGEESGGAERGQVAALSEDEPDVAIGELPAGELANPPAPPGPLDEPEDTGAAAPPVIEPGLAVEFGPVEAALPKIRIDGADQPEILEAARGVDGVQHASAITIGELSIETPAGATPLNVAAIDPVSFRSLTPQVTADAVEVWQRIVEGDAAFTHDVGHRLELELGERFPVEDRILLRVGAYASNGVPPVADAIVSQETARQLRVEGSTSILVAVASGDDVRAVAQAIEATTGLSAEILEQPQTRRAFLSGDDATEAFEPFTYVSYGDGMIEIDPGWVRRNITSSEMPILRGQVTCHRQMIPQLRGALQEIEDSGLAHLIDPSQYGGCWVPRHILFNPSRPLSMHAWGLAVDLNVRGNEYGNRNFAMDPRVVEIFDRWGFHWGGRWSTPDAMHFQLGALIEEG